MKELLDLFFTFCSIGAITFGGGYAMLPIIQKEIVEKKQWATQEEIIDYYAIGQSIPGIIAINTATFIGFKRKGIPGAIAATTGMVFPSIVIITLIATFLKNFQQNPIVEHAFAGIRVAVAALIINTLINMLNNSVNDWFCIFLFSFSFIAVTFFNVSPIVIVVLSAVLGIAAKMVRADKS